MSERESWMPSDEKARDAFFDTLNMYESDDPEYLEALRALLRAAVEKAVAEAKFERAETVRLLEAERGLWDLERARHAREQVEFTGAALYEFGVSGDDAAPGEAPGNFLLRLIRESKATHAREIEKARLEAKIEAWTEAGCYFNHGLTDGWCDGPETEEACLRCYRVYELRATLATMDKE